MKEKKKKVLHAFPTAFAARTFKAAMEALLEEAHNLQHAGVLTSSAQAKLAEIEASMTRVTPRSCSTGAEIDWINDVPFWQSGRLRKLEKWL